MGAVQYSRLWTFDSEEDDVANRRDWSPSEGPTDPRSPTSKVARTPLQERTNQGTTVTPPRTGKPPTFAQTQWDPRSPTIGVSRTPVLAEQLRRQPLRPHDAARPLLDQSRTE